MHRYSQAVKLNIRRTPLKIPVQGQRTQIFATCSGDEQGKDFGDSEQDAIVAERRILNFIPTNPDDAASHSWLLHRHGVRNPDNRKLLVHQRERQGRFYTWLVPRFKAGRVLLDWVRVVCEITPGQMILAWQRAEADYSDIHGKGSAKLQLGMNPSTLPGIGWLVRVVGKAEELNNSGWYRNPFTLRYALSRCHHASISGFEHLKSLAITLVTKEQRPNESFRIEPMHTASALNTRLNCLISINLPSLPHRARFIKNQASDGGGPTAPSYYAGRRMHGSGESRELTTGISLEALIRLQSRNPLA